MIMTIWTCQGQGQFGTNLRRIYLLCIMLEKALGREGIRNWEIKSNQITKSNHGLLQQRMNYNLKSRETNSQIECLVQKGSGEAKLVNSWSFLVNPQYSLACYYWRLWATTEDRLITEVGMVASGYRLRKHEVAGFIDGFVANDHSSDSKMVVVRGEGE